MTAVRIDTVDFDVKELAPCFDAADQARKDGKKGVVLAQVFEFSMIVEFIEHEWADQINAVLKARKEAILKQQKESA